MRGGYSWRIAVPFVNFEDMERGPTGWGLNRNEVLIVNDPVTGEELIDDDLTPAEEELICGSYRCLTGVWSCYEYKPRCIEICTYRPRQTTGCWII